MGRGQLAENFMMMAHQLVLFVPSLVYMGRWNMVHFECLAQKYGAEHIMKVGNGVERYGIQFMEESLQSHDSFVVVERNAFKMNVRRQMGKEWCSHFAAQECHFVFRISFGERV